MENLCAGWLRVRLWSQKEEVRTMLCWSASSMMSMISPYTWFGAPKHHKIANCLMLNFSACKKTPSLAKGSMKGSLTSLSAA
jgi:hypothetical protein